MDTELSGSRDSRTWLGVCRLSFPSQFGRQAFGPRSTENGLGGRVYLSAVLEAGQELAQMLLLFHPPS